ncbi:MAG: MBL fold metallo-hydrolase [Candidatus Nomurabacteria bacterium]|nr:MBL fold metallo-hydrolase [Candidatus Nomurabacteria bacterium]
MIITYNGRQFFKIQQGDLTVAFNPISKDTKWDGKITRFGSDIALSTTNHPDYNGFDTVTHGDNVPFSVSGAGDYEIKGIFIKGVGTEASLGGKKYINTIYTISIENITLGILGPVSNDALTSAVRAQIEAPDILFVPIGGESLSVAEAYKVGLNLEAKIIIPMDYDEKTLKAFLKEGGQENTRAIEKLTIKAKELAGREGEIVVLDY